MCLSTYLDLFHGKQVQVCSSIFCLRHIANVSILDLSPNVYLQLWMESVLEARKEDRTILIGAADEGLALRAWPDHSGCRHRDAVLGPLLQPLQHHLLLADRGGGLLQEVLVHTAAF